MQLLFKILALVFTLASAVIALLYIWTDLISEVMLGKLLLTFIIVAGFAIVAYFIMAMGGDKKLKKKGFMID